MKFNPRLTSLTLLILFSLWASACSSSLSEAQLEATARSMASTDVALTLSAIASSAPSVTETPSPSPSATSSPTTLSSETVTATSTIAPKLQITWNPYGQPDSGSFATAKADKSTGDTPLLLENQSGERVQFNIVSPYYQAYVFTNNLGIVLPQGEYKYMAWIGDKGPFSGSFILNNPDKHVLIFYSDKIHFSTP